MGDLATGTPVLTISDTDDIGFIAKKGIALLTDPQLRNALTHAYDSSIGLEAVQAAHRAFERLFSGNWSLDTLASFLANWRMSHGTAMFVSGLIVRMQREAERAHAQQQLLLFRASAEIGEIIAEDTGVDDTPHDELFERFANHLVGDDRWRLTRYRNSQSEHFRRYLQNQRLTQDIETAILTTAASENWNTGEYTYLDQRIHRWMTKYGAATEMGPNSADVTRYISTHSGPTELGHFLHAIKAWQLYCAGTGKEVKVETAHGVFIQYLAEIRSMFDSMC